MRKLTYFAVYELSSDGGYGVYFPDLPGCISYGATYEEAEKMAKKALGLHIYQMEKDDDDLPSSSEPSQLIIDEDTIVGYIISPVTVFLDMVKNDMMFTFEVVE